MPMMAKEVFNMIPLKYVNCADCGRTLIGDTTRDKVLATLKPNAWGKTRWPSDLRMPVAGRILQRPYCGPCLKRKPSVQHVTDRREIDPEREGSQENAVRALEG